MSASFKADASAADRHIGAGAPHSLLRDYYSDENGRLRHVRLCFDDSARDYDRVNAIFSFGSGGLYRAWTLRRYGLRRGGRVLDVGSGTGVIAAAAQKIVGDGGLVVALDPSARMLEQARSKGVQRLVPGVAERLPLASASFEHVTLGYALRHVSELTATFRELLRVLIPGGTLIVLELGRPASRIGTALLRFHVRTLVPLANRLLGGRRQTQVLMHYSWETIEHCVPPAAILAALQEAGLERIQRRTWFGVFNEYIAARPSDPDRTQAEHS